MCGRHSLVDNVDVVLTFSVDVICYLLTSNLKSNCSYHSLEFVKYIEFAFNPYIYNLTSVLFFVGIPSNIMNLLVPGT